MQSSLTAKRWNRIWINARIVTCAQDTLNIIEAGAIASFEGRIAWVGAIQDLPAPPETMAHEVYDLHGALLTPGLTDCHTHIVYAGNRAKEFDLRLKGASYEEISKAGGGILSTVKATRETSEEALFEASAGRLRSFLREGVTTIEIKSGYGLNTQTEMRMLRVARKLGEQFPITVKTSFLGAHAIPPEFINRADEYVDYICEEMLPEIAHAGLADAVDGFCETIGFSVQQIEKIFSKARALSLPIKLHAEQLSNQNGAALVAAYKGLSADHLEHIDEAAIEKMAQAETVAVMLPVAFYYLRETKAPPIALLRKHGVPMAVSTDSNPGTAPVESLLLAMNMAAVCFRMTVDEIFLGVTIHAAKALGMSNEAGSLEVGKRADFAIWNTEHPAELVYRVGVNACIGVVQNGNPTAI